MSDLIFNKVVDRRKSSNKPSVTFRRLTGDKERYQGYINTNGALMIGGIINSSAYELEILFSDEHSIIGVKPVVGGKKAQIAFGATPLFNSLSLKVGVKYELSLNNGFATIESNEHLNEKTLTN